MQQYTYISIKSSITSVEPGPGLRPDPVCHLSAHTCWCVSISITAHELDFTHSPDDVKNSWSQYVTAFDLPNKTHWDWWAQWTAKTSDVRIDLGSESRSVRTQRRVHHVDTMDTLWPAGRDTMRRSIKEYKTVRHSMRQWDSVKWHKHFICHFNETKH